MTSNPHKLVLFKKQGCPPCIKAKAALDKVLFEYPKFEECISVLQKENHPALVAAYELQLYPTVLILDQQLDEIDRRVGGNSLTEDWWFTALFTVYNNRTSN